MKTAVIYLAAGNSRRFGENKLLYEIDGKPMYRHLLERLVRICGRHPGWKTIVVTQYPEIMEDVEKMEASLPVRAVFSPDSFRGASWSVRAGVQAARDMDAAAGAFFVADQPYLSEKSAEEFLEYMAGRAAEDLGCVCHGETSGNPVWFARSYFPELERLEGDRGGKTVLREHAEDVHFFRIEDERELQDLDELPKYPPNPG